MREGEKEGGEEHKPFPSPINLSTSSFSSCTPAPLHTHQMSVKIGESMMVKGKKRKGHHDVRRRKGKKLVEGKGTARF